MNWLAECASSLLTWSLSIAIMSSAKIVSAITSHSPAKIQFSQESSARRTQVANSSVSRSFRNLSEIDWRHFFKRRCKSILAHLKTKAKSSEALEAVGLPIAPFGFSLMALASLHAVSATCAGV